MSSSFELETQLILVNDLFNLDVEELIIKINELQRMIVGFKKSISIKLDQNNNLQDIKNSKASLI